MSPPALLEALYKQGTRWTGHGVAVECGSWLGATTAALASGLCEAGYRDPFHCFDRWQADRMEVEQASALRFETEVGQNLEPAFRDFVSPFYPYIRTHRGPFRRATWEGEPIEFFLMGAAKKEPNFGRLLRVFGPSWIPKRTVVGFLDYRYYQTKLPKQRERFRCQERFVERYAGCFERIDEVGTAVLFRYTRTLPWGEVGRPRWRRTLSSIWTGARAL